MKQSDEHRTRSSRSTVRMTPEEREWVNFRIATAGNPKFNAYACRALLTSKIIHVDFTDTKELIRQMARIGNNLNQLAHVANENEVLTQEQMNMVKSEVDDLFWAVNDHLLYRLDVVKHYERVVLNGNHENTRD